MCMRFTYQHYNVLVAGLPVVVDDSMDLGGNTKARARSSERLNALSYSLLELELVERVFHSATIQRKRTRSLACAHVIAYMVNVVLSSLLSRLAH